MRAYFQMLASPPGRAFRAGLGLAFAAIGLTLGTVEGFGLVVFGAIAFLAGALDVCIFAPLAGLSMLGEEIRTHKLRLSH